MQVIDGIAQLKIENATTAQIMPSTQSYLELQNYDIVCVSVMDWDWPFPTSRHSLMREFARANRVLFVDPPLNYFSDYRALLNNSWHRARLKRGLSGKIIQREANLYSFTPPPAIPFNRLPQSLHRPVLHQNGRFFSQAVRQAARKLGMQRPLLWISFNPYFGLAVCGNLNEQLVLYHCTDEVRGFPGLSPRIQEIEQRLIQRSDLVVTTSQVLQATKQAFNPNTFFVPNGANVSLFRQALEETGPLPPELLDIPEPRVGFAGQIEFRFDVGLMAEIARLRPEISFVLIGKEGLGGKDLARLQLEPNIYLLGNKPQSDLPRYLRGMRATIIPYKHNELTRSIYPLKLHEYLATGRGVVATPLPSLQEFAELIKLATTPPEFVTALDEVIAHSADSELARQRLAVAEEHSWQRVAGTISHLLVNSLANQGQSN